jgi:hypothetical protein
VTETGCVDLLLGIIRSSGRSPGTAALQAVSREEWVAILGIARKHGVAPLLHRALKAGEELSCVPDPVRQDLEDERHATALANLRNLGKFRLVAQALQARGIPVIALKGLHLAELVYRDVSLRPMSDLDILVPRALVRQAVATLYEVGYGFDAGFSGASSAMLDMKCDVELADRATGSTLEVHWSLSVPPGRYDAAIEEIWRSAVPARVGDAEALVMSPEFALLHVCAHLACHHVFVFNLRALCDIAEIVRASPDLDWTVVADHGKRYGWGRGVAAALRLASDHLGAAVPADILASLGADALDPGMLGEAMEHLVASGDMPEGLGHAANLIAFAGTHGLAGKLAGFWARIFVPRPELSVIYGVPEHSARLSLYYAVRLKDLLGRYVASAWALHVSHPRLAAAAARHARLAKWVNGV